jgi:hypothetical protein
MGGRDIIGFSVPAKLIPAARWLRVCAPGGSRKDRVRRATQLWLGALPELRRKGKGGLGAAGRRAPGKLPALLIVESLLRDESS